MVTLSLYIPTLAPYTDEAIAEVQDAINEHLAKDVRKTQPTKGLFQDISFIDWGTNA